jgi:hypothetical protein
LLSDVGMSRPAPILVLLTVLLPWLARASVDPGMYTCERSYTIVKKTGPFGDTGYHCGPPGSGSVIYYYDLAHYKCSDNSGTSGYYESSIIDQCSPAHEIQNF